MMKEIDILDADATTIAIKKLILEAREYVVLICPYLDLSASIIASIQKAIERHVTIHVVYRVDNPTDAAKCAHIEKDLVAFGCDVTHCRRLHTKCYMNEQVVIISSLNLLTSSQSGNFELSTRFDIESHLPAYGKVMQHIEDIYRVSGKKLVLKKEEPKPIPAPVKTVHPKDNNAGAQPKRFGKNWTSAEEQLVYNYFVSGKSYAEMAEKLSRTETAITGRLQQMGLIRYDSQKKQYVKCKVK